MERLGAVSKVGGEESKGVRMEVEFVFQFIKKFFMGYGVIGFGEV